MFTGTCIIYIYIYIYIERERDTYVCLIWNCGGWAVLLGRSLTTCKQLDMHYTWQDHADYELNRRDPWDTAQLVSLIQWTQVVLFFQPCRIVQLINIGKRTPHVLHYVLLWPPYASTSQSHMPYADAHRRMPTLAPRVTSYSAKHARRQL